MAPTGTGTWPAAIGRPSWLLLGVVSLLLLFSAWDLGKMALDSSTGAPVRSVDTVRRYREALVAPSAQAGLDLCNGLDGFELRGECGVAVVARFKDFDYCKHVVSARWKAECELLDAGRLASVGQYGSALKLCGRNPYWEQCLDQVIGAFSSKHASADATHLDADWTPVSGYAGSGLGDARMWAAWHAARIRLNLRVTVADCPRVACIDGARAAMVQAIRVTGHDACDPRPPWAEGDAAGLFDTLAGTTSGCSGVPN